MKFQYNKDYFITTNPHIDANDELREPQIEAYNSTFDYFIKQEQSNHAIIILPTGVGKTGLLGLLPFKHCNGRALIITPRIVIKDVVLDALNPENPGNFWLKRKVFDNLSELPTCIQYEGDQTRDDWLNVANLVVLNVHKLQERLDSSLINRVDQDFFDMIIIDEAHHSTAKTWVDTVNYFNKAKVIKLTGTPFRSDDEKIVGEVIYNYKLSQAMAKGYIKSLKNITYVPDKLFLTLDMNEDKQYTVEEIYQLKLKDEDWVTRSVAFSNECSQKIVKKSIELLNYKKGSGSNIPHKIIAVAMSIWHAEQIKILYENEDINAAIIHSDMNKEDIDKSLKDIDNHRIDVVINVAMLGEGYDHPYLSIAAIFRPFRNLLPYVQFVGRILRKIPHTENLLPDDNIGEIISHEHIYITPLWEYYKKEVAECETIKYLESQTDLDDFDEPDEANTEGRRHSNELGTAKEAGEGTLIGDTFLETEITKERDQRLKEEKEKVDKIIELLNIPREEALKMVRTAESSQNLMKRPDLYFKKMGKDIDNRIKEDIVPSLITDYSIDKEGDSLKRCIRLFGKNEYSWIPNTIKNNAGMLATFFNKALVKKLGRQKKDWTMRDYEIANKRIDEIEEFVRNVLEDFS